jgi:hypothetical protein
MTEREHGYRRGTGSHPRETQASKPAERMQLRVWSVSCIHACLHFSSFQALTESGRVEPLRFLQEAVQLSQAIEHLGLFCACGEGLFSCLSVLFSNDLNVLWPSRQIKNSVDESNGGLIPSSQYRVWPRFS